MRSTSWRDLAAISCCLAAIICMGVRACATAACVRYGSVRNGRGQRPSSHARRAAKGWRQRPLPGRQLFARPAGPCMPCPCVQAGDAAECGECIAQSIRVWALRRESEARGARESAGRHLGHLEGERVHDRPAHVGTDQPRGQHALEHALTGAANSGDLPGGMWFVPACQPGKRRQRGEVLRKRWAASRPRKTRRMRPRS